MMNFPEKCPRGLTNCQPTGQVLAEDESSFCCAGERTDDPATWDVEQDIFTLCWKSQDGVDVIQYMDQYDMHTQLYVLSRALLLHDLGDAPASEGRGQ